MYTNAHIIRQNSFQYGLVSFPDKYSMQAEQKRRNGYKLRIYHQFKSSLKHGCVVFDTLTYDDAHLPRVDDFLHNGDTHSCFNPDDIRNWLWYLRDLVDEPFKVFLTSEYGSEHEYTDYRGRLRKATHRPHYHVLFFFDNKIDPFFFARFVHKSWKRGRTDNYGNCGEVSRNKVLHNFFDNQSVDQNRLVKLANYLSKYTLKDAKYSRYIEDMCKKEVRKNYPNLNNINRKAFNHDVRKLTSHLQPFLRISNGFGLSACEDIEVLRMIFERGEMRMPDSLSVWKYFSLPTYYKRKLFYRCVDGQWQLTAIGKIYYPIMLAQRSKRLASLYQNAVANMPADAQSVVTSLLDGRSYSELAEYSTYYKGRIFNPAMLDCYPTKQFVVHRFVDDDFFGRLSDPQVYIEYSKAVEPRTLYVWFDDNILLPCVVSMEVNKRKITRSDDWHQWIIDDSWFEPWYGFDDVLQIIHYYMALYDVDDSSTYFAKKQLQLDLFSKYNIKSVV